MRRLRQWLATDRRRRQWLLIAAKCWDCSKEDHLELWFLPKDLIEIAAYIYWVSCLIERWLRSIWMPLWKPIYLRVAMTSPLICMWLKIALTCECDKVKWLIWGWQDVMMRWGKLTRVGKLRLNLVLTWQGFIWCDKHALSCICLLWLILGLKWWLAILIDWLISDECPMEPTL